MKRQKKRSEVDTMVAPLIRKCFLIFVKTYVLLRRSLTTPCWYVLPRALKLLLVLISSYSYEESSRLARKNINGGNSTQGDEQNVDRLVWSWVYDDGWVDSKLRALLNCVDRHTDRRTEINNIHPIIQSCEMENSFKLYFGNNICFRFEWQ